VIQFRLRLRAVSLLTVGWGLPDILGADVVHARKPRKTTEAGRIVEVPYIPGSSVKGALRTAASRVAVAYGFTSCSEVEPELIEKAHAGKPCDVCRLFGYPGDNPSAMSRLWISDFNPVEEPKTTIIVRVTLDNRTLTAVKGALYSMEHLLPGSEFVGEARVDDEAKSLVPLLLLAIAELRTGRFGRRSMIDVKIEDDGVLDSVVEAKWHPLLKELKNWLWEGVTG